MATPRVRGDKAKRLYDEFRKYCLQNGAPIKVYGDYAYRSQGYQEKNNRGRYIKLVSLKNGRIKIYDNKKGYVDITGIEK